MKRLSITTVMIIALAFLLTGCGRTLAPAVNTQQLQNEAGDFQYENIPWGIDRTSVEAALGVAFDQGTISKDDVQLNLATDAYTMMRLPATVICEFDASGLYSISFRIKPAEKDVQACWDSLTDALLTQYGSVDPVSTDSGQSTQLNIRTENYVWQHSGDIHTALRARKTTMNGNTPFIEVMVYVIPADRVQQ